MRHQRAYHIAYVDDAEEGSKYVMEAVISTNPSSLNPGEMIRYAEATIQTLQDVQDKLFQWIVMADHVALDRAKRLKAKKAGG